MRFIFLFFFICQCNYQLVASNQESRSVRDIELASRGQQLDVRLLEDPDRSEICDHAYPFAVTQFDSGDVGENGHHVGRGSLGENPWLSVKDSSEVDGGGNVKDFLLAVKALDDTPNMCAPKEVLTFLVSATIAYGTAIGTFRDLVEATYPTVGLSVHLEDYSNEATWKRLLIGFNYAVFHTLQAPTYYAVFEPYVRWILNAIPPKTSSNEVEINEAGTKKVKILARALNVVDSIADASIDSVRYIGNTGGLIRNQLSYPLYFSGIFLKSFNENKYLERRALRKFPGYDSDILATRKQLSKWMDLAYNAIYFSGDQKELSDLYSAYQSGDMGKLIELLVPMVKTEKNQVRVNSMITATQYKRLAIQALMLGTLLPVWYINYFTLGKLLEDHHVTNLVLSTLLTASRIPVAIMGVAGIYNRVAGVPTNYAYERSLGVRVPAHYVIHAPFSASVGNVLYGLVLSVPMTMTFITMGLTHDLSLPLMILGSGAVAALESVAKQPIVDYWYLFKHKLFYGEKIESTVENKDYIGVGAIYNLGVGGVNLLRGNELTVVGDDSNAALIRKEFFNWLLAGKRIEPAQDAGCFKRVCAGVANTIRHFSIAQPFDRPADDSSYFGWFINKCVDGANYMLYRPDLTKEQRDQNRLLEFVRTLAIQTGVAVPEILEQLKAMIDPSEKGFDFETV